MVQHTSPTKHGLPAGNPLANLLVVIAGIVAIATLIVLGFFAFVALSAVMLIAATIIGLRGWWLRRRGGTTRPSHAQRSERGSSEVIEGEYRVVERDRDQP